MSSFTNRIIRAARLDVTLYEEVKADEGAMGQAIGVVVLSSLAAGVGNSEQIGVGGILRTTFLALIAWFIWASLIYPIGTKLLPEPQTKGNFGKLLRTIGFSSSPGLIRVLGFIPGLAILLNLAAAIWMLVAMVIAVRQSLDYRSTFRAVGVCLIGPVILWGFIFLVFFLIFYLGASAR